MGKKGKESKVRYGEPIYASEPAPTKGRPIIPNEGDNESPSNVYVIVNLNVCSAHDGHCGK